MQPSSSNIEAVQKITVDATPVIQGDLDPSNAASGAEQHRLVTDALERALETLRGQGVALSLADVRISALVLEYVRRFEL